MIDNKTIRQVVINSKLFPCSGISYHEVTGSICNFKTDLAAPLKSCEVTVTPTQSGTGDPLPTNPRPLNSFSSLTVEHTGANICGGNALLSNCQNYLPTGTTDTVNKTFKFTSGTATDNGYSFASGIKFKANTTYTVILSVEKSNSNSALNMRIRYTDGTNLDFSMPESYEVDTKYTVIFTSNASKTILDVRKSSVSGGTTLYYEECGIFEGSLTESDFAPYTADPHTIALGSTVYGLTGDCMTGEFEETYKAVKFSSLNWTYQSNNTRFYTSDLANLIVKPETSGEKSDLLCDVYKTVSFSAFSNNNEIAVATSGNIFLRDTNYTTKEAFIEAMGDYYLCYPLATPSALSTDPVEVESFKGVNNIWCAQDNSNVAVEYRADIDLLISELGG